MSGTYRCRGCQHDADDVYVTGEAVGTVTGCGYAYEKNGELIFEYDMTDDYDVDMGEYTSFQCPACGYGARTIDMLFEYVEASYQLDADGVPVREGDTVRIVGNFHDEQQVEDMLGEVHVVETLDADDDYYPFKVCPDTGGEVWLCSQDVRLHVAPVVNEKGKVVTGERVELSEAAKTAVRLLLDDPATQALTDLGL